MSHWPPDEKARRWATAAPFHLFRRHSPRTGQPRRRPPRTGLTPTSAYGARYCRSSRTTNVTPPPACLPLADAPADPSIRRSRPQPRPDLFQNPAPLRPRRNQGVCGCAWRAGADELVKVARGARQASARRHTEQGGAAPSSQGSQGQSRPRCWLPLADAESACPSPRRRTRRAFVRVRQRLFNRPYHDAVPRLPEQFVYPAKDGHYPAWLTEGPWLRFSRRHRGRWASLSGRARRRRTGWGPCGAAIGRQAAAPADLLRSAPRHFPLVAPRSISRSRKPQLSRVPGRWRSSAFERPAGDEGSFDDYVRLPEARRRPARRLQQNKAGLQSVRNF